MQNLNTTTRSFQDILAICLSKELKTYTGMTDQTQQKLHDRAVASMDI